MDLTMKPEATISDQTSRTARPVRLGVVVAGKNAKTITVRINRMTTHPKYGKLIRRRTRLRAHDESGQAKVGDTVEIMECRPVSKTKKWRLIRVVKTAQHVAIEAPV